MKKNIILGYFIAAIATAMLMSVILFQMANGIEEKNRQKIETLTHAIAAAKADDDGLIQLQSSLKTFLGDEVLLTISNGSELRIHWQSRFAATGDSQAWTILIGAPFLLTVCLLLTPTLLYKTIILPQTRVISQLNEDRKNQQSMQMFAHDVRKPFSALKALLEILDKGSVTNSMEAVVKRLLPEIDSLLGHVDGMITDLIKQENSNDALPHGDTTALDKILDAAVSESAKRHPNSFLPIDWNLQHSLKPNGGEKALVRCFSNLICNAIEAVGAEEKLWIKSRDSKINGELAIEVIIGNSGRPIPIEVLKNLFTPFFTSGKAGGTGLGLAYVKQTLEDLNGYAAARSDGQRGTEFILTIPALPMLDKVTRDLPQTVNPLHNQMMDLAKITITPLNILVVDDQAIYFESLIAAGIETIGATNHSVFHATKYCTVATLIEQYNFDLVLCDIDLGSDSADGIEVIKLLKSKNSHAQIYVYSNKNLDAADLRFVELSTDGALRKPANAIDLEKVFCKLNRAKVPLPLVAIIDDDCFVRELWSMQHDVINTQLFASPEDFLAKLSSDPKFVEQFDAFIVDYFFADDSIYTGDQIAIKIRALTQTPIIISSDIQTLPESARSFVTGQIGKDCQSWSEVQALIDRCA